MRSADTSLVVVPVQDGIGKASLQQKDCSRKIVDTQPQKLSIALER